jgi:two-component system phosphate regulon sensor histidine kinase PhoR
MFDIPETLCIKADKNKMEQVFSNLIENAIKFNVNEGKISISAIVEKDKTKISIEDTGIGIPEKDLPRIFERFYRVDKGRSRELGGTGLGLSIVKHIIELHNGSISVESELNKGTKFTIIIPQ